MHTPTHKVELFPMHMSVCASTRSWRILARSRSYGRASRNVQGTCRSWVRACARACLILQNFLQLHVLFDRVLVTLVLLLTKVCVRLHLRNNLKQWRVWAAAAAARGQGSWAKDSGLAKDSGNGLISFKRY